MNLIFDFSEEKFIKLCSKNIQRNNTTIFQDIYEALIYFLNIQSVDTQLNISEIKHSYKTEYYDKYLSLKEYIDNGFIDFYYLKIDIYSLKEHSISFNKITLPNFLKLNQFDYGFNTKKSIKIKEYNLKTKNRITIELLQLKVNKDTLIKIMENINNTNKEIFLPSKLGVWEWRQTFYNKINGQVYFCNCFKEALKKTQKDNCLTNIHQHIKIALKNKNFQSKICHICLGTNSDLFYCHKMYGSPIKVKYGAYIKKLEIEKDIDEKEAENQIRELKGVAKIGDKWVNETILFNYINILFSEYSVEREASPIWLDRQRLDIFIPELNLAIEYQGEQHFKPVSIFGGNEGLLRAKERDKLKLQKCKSNKIDLIYFTYKENLSEKLVEKKLKAYLKEKT